jgi:hypothetical protein
LIRTVESEGAETSKKTFPRLSTVTIIFRLGISRSALLFGTFTSTGSVDLKVADNIKKVTKRNARSTIGVISIDGELLGILILGIPKYVQWKNKIKLLPKSHEQW